MYRPWEDGLTRRAIEDRIMFANRVHRTTRPNGRFTVGRDATGHWIVADAKGLCGGVFANRSAALHYALEECNYEAGEVCTAGDDEILDLDLLFVSPQSAGH